MLPNEGGYIVTTGPLLPNKMLTRYKSYNDTFGNNRPYKKVALLPQLSMRAGKSYTMTQRKSSYLSKSLRNNQSLNARFQDKGSKPELKYVEYYNGSGTQDKVLGTTFYFSTQVGGSLQYLNAIQEGTTNYERIGNKTQCVSIQLNIWATMANTGLAQAAIIRWWLIMDKEPRGLGSAVGDIFDIADLPTAAASDNYSITVSPNLLYSKRFVTLKEGRIDLDGGHGYLNNQEVFIKTRFTTSHLTTGYDYASMGENGIFFVACSNNSSGTANANAPLLIWKSRVRFTDC